VAALGRPLGSNLFKNPHPHDETGKKTEALFIFPIAMIVGAVLSEVVHQVYLMLLPILHWLVSLFY
jgi:hypothetical protein